MNNVIDKKYNTVSRNERNIYSEASGERLISFFCVIIAFFENELVGALCRAIGLALLAAGTFFYASGVMSGALSAVGTVIYGVLLIGAAALVFRTKTVKGE